MRRVIFDHVAVRRICLACVSLATLAAAIYALAVPYHSAN